MLNTKVFIYLSELLGNDVVDKNGHFIGRVNDIVMRLSEEVYPRAAGVIVRRGFWQREFAYLPIENVREINDEFTLKVDRGQIQFQLERGKYDFTLCNDILDRQVVDTDNRKVVRVNDVHLLRVDNHLYLAHVDVGSRALVRRLEWTGFIDALVRFSFPKSPYLNQEEFISWRNTQILATGRYKQVLRLDVARQKLSQIPATDLAEIMEDLDIFEKLALFKSLDVQVQRRVFTDLATQEKEELIDRMEEREAASLLENIPADEATDLLLTLPQERMVDLMRYMQTEVARKLRKLLGFARNSAGGLMTTEYIALKKEVIVKDAIQAIKNNVDYSGNIYQVYVVDDQHRLLGLTTLRRFINAEPESLLIKTCYETPIAVHTDDSMEEVALILEKYKFSAVPVVNDEDILQGVVTSDDVMEELISLVWSKYREKLN